MSADARSADGVAALEATAAGFDPGVPLVLMPVRIETRFAQVEVADAVVAGEALIEALQALLDSVRQLAQRSYATVLTGTVKQKKQQKLTIEQPM